MVLNKVVCVSIVTIRRENTGLIIKDKGEDTYTIGQTGLHFISNFDLGIATSCKQIMLRKPIKLP